jgi:heat shock transcription factor 4
MKRYGFHKVNKSPRGHRTLAENQIWEFSHSNFLRDRPDLLDDIKRKTMESDTVRRETGDLHAHMAMMQVSQSDMLQQLNQLFENFNQIAKELEYTKQKQESHQKFMKDIMQYIIEQNGGNNYNCYPMDSVQMIITIYDIYSMLSLYPLSTY